MLRVVKGQNEKILRTVCAPVVEFDNELEKLAKEMIETMHDPKAPGIGIAAPQVGVDARIFIFTYGAGSKAERDVVVVNPKVLRESEEVGIAEEGCLSLPGKYGNVLRSREIEVEYQDLDGEVVKQTLRDLDARVFLHELDHLNGVLFVDKVVDGLVM